MAFNYSAQQDPEYYYDYGDDMPEHGHHHEHSATGHEGHHDKHGSDVMTNGHHAHGNHSEHSGHGAHSGHGGHGMKMYFHCSNEAVILFSFWNTSSWAEMLGSCIGIFLLAALYEGLKVFREYLLRKSTVNVQYSTVPVRSADEAMVSETSKTVGAKMLSLAHLIQTLLHVIQIVVSYFLMLIFMTYNVWLCLAVALGAGAGYFIFSWRRAIVVDINEHCH